MTDRAATNAGRAPSEYYGERISGFRTLTKARDETAALMAEIVQIEREIDERVGALYGL